MAAGSEGVALEPVLTGSSVVLPDSSPQDMWASLLQLLVVSLAMFLGAFLAGLLPLSLSMNQRQLKLVNALGAGLLLGTALAVIVPEGVHLYYDESHEEHSLEELNHSHDEEQTGEVSKVSLIGVALVAGFVFMLLVDNLSVFGGSHGHSHAASGETKGKRRQDEEESTELLELSRSEHDRLGDLSIATHEPKASSAKVLSKNRTTVTLGLIVHSLVDGMAVGVAQASGTKSAIQFVVFLAIMMHKVPAAFGLSVFLKSSGLGSSAIQKNLALFSVAAPAGAIFWFLLLNENFLNLASIGVRTTSLCMLFSAGTFLYVSTIHILSDIRGSGEGLHLKEICAICSGSVVPILLSAGHHH